MPAPCDLPTELLGAPFTLEQAHRLGCSLRAPRGAGVRGHRADLGDDVRDVGGLRVTSGARTWADLAPCWIWTTWSSSVTHCCTGGLPP